MAEKQVDSIEFHDVEEPWTLIEKVEEYEEDVTNVTSSDRYGDIVETRKLNSEKKHVTHELKSIENKDTGEKTTFDTLEEAKNFVLDKDIGPESQKMVDFMAVEITDFTGTTWLAVYEDKLGR